MTHEKASLTATEIIRMYEQYGGEEYAGEKITQLEHMVQAAQIAAMKDLGEDAVLAAFLHDIGHICVSALALDTINGFGIKNHEGVGSDYLAVKGFSPKVIRLVEAHVDAKRYLTFKDPEYYAQLSDASKETLKHQGGVMDKQEAIEFENDAYFPLIIEMRKIDELAKEEGLQVPPLQVYRQLIIQHLTSNNNHE